MRDTTFSILKGLALLFVVMASALPPIYLQQTAQLLGFPALFVAAGYLIKPEVLQAKTAFVVGRIKRIYFPFVFFGLLFLLLHNVFFSWGLLSTQMSAVDGSVTQPYTWQEAAQNLWNIVFQLSGYGNFLGQSLWILATLLIAHSGLLVLRVAAARIKWLNTEFKQLSAIAALVLLLASWQSLMGLQIASIAGGGFRELMGIFFLSLGVLLRKIDSSEAFPALQNPIVGIAAGAIIVLPLAIFYPVAMTPTASIGQVWALAAGGCASFLLLRGLSSLLAPLPPKATQPFVFAGQYFFPILVFHLLAFKLVSLIKVAALGLPWDYVAQHPVVHTHPDAYFWVFYTLVGFGLPLGLCWSWHTLDEKYHLRQATPQEWLQLSIMCGKFLVRSLIAGAVFLYQFAVIGARAIFRGIIAFGRGIKNMVLSIIRASSPNDDDE